MKLSFTIYLDQLPLAGTVLPLRMKIQLNFSLFKISSTPTHCIHNHATCSAYFMPLFNNFTCVSILFYLRGPPTENVKISKLGKKYCVALYRWLQQQSTYVETKKEYDKSSDLLNEFLNRPRTINDLKPECIKAIRLFQDHICTRETKLGNHMRMDIRNCNEACTPSPVESMNSTFKGGTSKVNSNMNLDKSTQHITSGINTR